jgi:hypothetical protein
LRTAEVRTGILVSPICGVLALGDHDCFCSEFWALAPESKIRRTTAFRVEFGLKEDTNRISGRAKKDKRTVSNL